MDRGAFSAGQAAARAFGMKGGEFPEDRLMRKQQEQKIADEERLLARRRKTNTSLLSALGGDAMMIPAFAEQAESLVDLPANEAATGLQAMMKQGFAQSPTGQAAKASGLQVADASRTKAVADASKAVSEARIKANDASLSDLQDALTVTPGGLINQAFEATYGVTVPTGHTAAVGPDNSMQAIPIPGGKEYDTQRSELRALEQGLMAMQNITSMIEKHGVELGGENARIMAEQWEQLVTARRVADNLGTPQAAEFKMLADRFTKPHGLNARAAQVYSALGPGSILEMLAGGNPLDVVTGQQYVNNMLATYDTSMQQAEEVVGQMRKDRWYLEATPGVGVP